MKITIKEDQSFGIEFLIGLLNYLKQSGYKNIYFDSTEDNYGEWFTEIHVEQ